jgi:hypothetical protein
MEKKPLKTQLPLSIKTIDEAKTFLSELHKNNEHYHPEDNAADIEWPNTLVSLEQRSKLNRCMNDIYNLPSFDPCEYLLYLDHYRSKPKSLAQINRHINRVHRFVILVRGEGYFYIASDHKETALKIAGLPSSSVYVYSINDLTIEAWVDSVTQLLKQAQEMPDVNPAGERF